jgi:hypothetical protein
VVAAGTKDDVFAATALTRALMGRLGHFAPDGTEPTPAGARQVRCSPVTSAADWDQAVTTAETMVSVANATLGGHSSDGGFWSIQAGGLLAPAARRGHRRLGHAPGDALGDAQGPHRGQRDPR